MKAPFFLFNGNLVSKNTPVIPAGNRGLCYGEGVFETMRYRNGTITNWDIHMDRFFSSLEFLEYSVPLRLNANFLWLQIATLVEANTLTNSARIRLMAFGSNDSIFEDKKQSPEIIIEAEPALFSDRMNARGFVVGLFTKATKSCDPLSNIKSNNYLPSILAIKYARDQKLDDCILLNAFGRVAETSTANLFIIKNGLLITPPLSEGCVNGTVRRWILNNHEQLQVSVVEREVTLSDIKEADELFLTNAIKPMRWVEQFEDRIYGNIQNAAIADRLYKNMVG